MSTRPTGPRILVLDPRGDLTQDVVRLSSGLMPPPKVLHLRRPTQVCEAVDRSPVDVVIAGAQESTVTGLRRLARLHRAHPGVVIVLSQNGTALPAREALTTGASEVLTLPARGLRARNALQRAVDQALAAAAAEVAPSPAAEVPAESAPPAKPVRTPGALGHVVTVTSATGGCGKTFFATNFAGYLARATGSRVLLCDLDLQFGEVSVALRLRPDRTIAELVDGREIAAGLCDALVEHGAGYEVLCAPKDPIAADRVGPREATEVIEAARAMFDYIVVDTPPALNEVVLAAFDLSESLVVMATMDVPSLKNMGVFLHTLDRLKVPADRVSLVLNKAEDGTGIELEHVLRLYPQGFSAVLPYAREVSRSINVGMPVVFSNPDAEVSRKLVDGARRLVAPSEGVVLPWDREPHHRSFLRRLIMRGA